MEEDLKWYIAILADGTYRFIQPDALKEAQKFIGKNGGGVYTYAGYLVFASSKAWYEALVGKYNEKYKYVPVGKRPPHLDLPNIECTFSEKALQWLEENENRLIEKGGKIYDNIPQPRD